MVTFGPVEGTSAINVRDGIGSTDKAPSRGTSPSGSRHAVGSGTAGPVSGTAKGDCRAGGMGNGVAVVGAGVG